MYRAQVTRYLSAAAVAVVLPVTAGAAPLTLFDGTFNDADWNFVNQSSSNAPNFTTTTGHSNTGGNPGASRQTSYDEGGTWDDTYQTLVVPNGTSTTIITLNINNTFTYDPSVSGAITDLTVSFDVEALVDRTYTEGLSFRALIEQNGVYYNSNLALRSTRNSWKTLTFHAPLAADWDVAGLAQTGAPDFSATAAPIRFGYRIGLQSTCSIPNPNVVGCFPFSGTDVLDNFNVSVTGTNTTPVPEPSTLFLVGSGLLGAAVRRNRRA